MVQELLTFPEHLSSPPVFSGLCVTRSLILYVCVVDVVCPFVLFLLAIVLSILRFTDYDYPFGIFKLFLQTFVSLFRDYIYHNQLNGDQNNVGDHVSMSVMTFTR